MSSPKAGESFWLESIDQKNSDFYFDNTKLSRISPTKFFGVIPLYKNDQAVIMSLSNISRGLFSHPTQDIAGTITSLQVRKLDNPSSIRIPANFFNELQKIEATQIDQEKSTIKSSLLKESPGSFCLETQLPIKSKQVSQFGSYRRLPTGMQYFHTGLDLRAMIGTKVYAMADGKVSIANKFVIPGNAVIIDHGNAIFSKYYHLSELLVKPGQNIKKGELIAKSGNTGRVEAPHLHWEVAWKGIVTDPLVFMETVKMACF
ncbi:MAG: M23 family metallopeptidase [Bdellovibrionota bacterium]